jgi:aspartate-semialdehyde dehydrogenase
MESEMPAEIAEMPVANIDVKSCEATGKFDFVFTSLPGDLAGPTENEFGAKYPVFSKASAHRMDKDVP